MNNKLPGGFWTDWVCSLDLPRELNAGYNHSGEISFIKLWNFTTFFFNKIDVTLEALYGDDQINDYSLHFYLKDYRDISLHLEEFSLLFPLKWI